MIVQPITRRIAACAALLALAACGGSGGEAPGAVSEGEARALEEAAQMLDERRLPEGAMPQIQPPVEQAAGQEPSGDTISPPEVTGDSAQ